MILPDNGALNMKEALGIMYLSSVFVLKCHSLNSRSFLKNNFHLTIEHSYMLFIYQKQRQTVKAITQLTLS